jgi:hypothetical protein
VYYALQVVIKQLEDGNNHYLPTMSKLKKEFAIPPQHDQDP